MTADLRSAWRAHRHGPVVRLAMLLAVLTLAVAVTAMHAMGAGHAGGSMSMSSMSSLSTAPAAAHHGHADATAPIRAVSVDDGPALHAGSFDHGMGAMCLAVLPLLALALAHVLRRWRRTPAGRRQDAVRRLVRTPRAPPPWAAPDLTLLGVSRT